MNLHRNKNTYAGLPQFLYFLRPACRAVVLRQLELTGNRRFWVVRVHGNDKRGWDMPLDDVPQIWAEAKYYWENGEKLYLEGNVAEHAKAEQTAALENDEHEGL